MILVTFVEDNHETHSTGEKVELPKIKMLSTLKGLLITYMLMERSPWNKIFHAITYIGKLEYQVRCRANFFLKYVNCKRAKHIYKNNMNI